MKLNTQRTFRMCLNTVMSLAIAGTIPYMFTGASLYQHEVLGTAALVLVLYHCVMNQWWYKNLTKKKQTPFCKKRNVINSLLSVAAVILLISSIMIADAVFGVFAIPYNSIWHYTHLISGAAFVGLTLVHAFDHKRAR